MRRCCIAPLLTVALFCSACNREMVDPVPPLEINFEERCGLPEGRQRVYDPETGVFHIHFARSNTDSCSFRITKVAADLPKAIVFRLTGVPESYGVSGWPLACHVDGETYIIDLKAEMIEPNVFIKIIRDATLFRVSRDGEVVTVECTEKGRKLLKPGAKISFTFDSIKYW